MVNQMFLYSNKINCFIGMLFLGELYLISFTYTLMVSLRT